MHHFPKKVLSESPVKPVMSLLVLNFWAIKALCSYKLCSYVFSGFPCTRLKLITKNYKAYTESRID